MILTALSVWLVILVSFVGRSADLDQATLSPAISTLNTDHYRPDLGIEGRADELYARIWVPLPKSSEAEIDLSHLKVAKRSREADASNSPSPSPPCSIKKVQGPNHYSISYSPSDRLTTTRELNPRGTEVAKTEDRFYRIRVKKVPPIISSDPSFDGVEILCDLNLRPFRDTFADRKLRIAERGDPPADEDDQNAADGIVVSFSNLEGISDLQLFSETPDDKTPQDDRLLGSGTEVLAEWRDTRQAQFRDVILVLIGSLLGLAATCVIEWARPWLSAGRDG